MEEAQTELLGWEEAMAIIRSVDNDLVTSQLMNMANFELVKRFFQLKDFPAANFDMRFFMEVMRSFCSDHETLRKVLAGEDLRLFTEEDLLNNSEQHEAS